MHVSFQDSTVPNADVRLNKFECRLPASASTVGHAFPSCLIVALPLPGVVVVDVRAAHARERKSRRPSPQPVKELYWKQFGGKPTEEDLRLMDPARVP